MNIKLLEIDPVNYKYKKFEKVVLKKKAEIFKEHCLYHVDSNVHVQNELGSRMDLIEKCINGGFEDFVKSIGVTYEEYERLLPYEVSQAWSSLKLYLTNHITKTKEEFVVHEGRYYVTED